MFHSNNVHADIQVRTSERLRDGVRKPGSGLTARCLLFSLHHLMEAANWLIV